jgi:hypothetical protein
MTTITTRTLISASGRRAPTEVTVREEDSTVVKQYRRHRLGFLGHLRFYADGKIEYAFGRYVNSGAIVLRRPRS